MMKKNSTKRAQALRLKLSTPGNAQRLFELLHDPKQTDAGRREVGEWYDQLITDARLWLDSPELFPVVYPLAARRVEHNAKMVDDGARRAYRALQDILTRTAKGDTLDEIAREREAALRQRGEEIKAERLNAPEPKDKTSDEWRYWKLRRMEKAFEGSDSEAYQKAWDEFAALLKGLMADRSFWHVRYVCALLPHLIIARQEIDQMEARDRRSHAAMKGAAQRRKKGGAR